MVRGDFNFRSSYYLSSIKMARKIVFTADFATKKKGDIMECDGLLASQLVNSDKVAEYYTEKKPKPKS